MGYFSKSGSSPKGRILQLTTLCYFQMVIATIPVENPTITPSGLSSSPSLSPSVNMSEPVTLPPCLPSLNLTTVGSNGTGTCGGGRTLESPESVNVSHLPQFVPKLKTVTILGLFELTQNGNRRIHGASEQFAAELALHDINQKKILKKYRLRMVSNDTKCDAGVGVDAFFHALYTRKNIRVVSVLGSACSEVTERLAKVVPYWNIIQVSFGSTSPSLSHRKEFPYFYRTVSPVSSHNEAILALIRHFNWDTLSFFTENENRFTMPMNILVTDLEKANVTCRATLTFSQSDLTDQLQHLKDVDARVIIASFNSLLGPTIFCQVYQMGMWGRDYAWILIGKPEKRWWIGESDGRKRKGGHYRDPFHPNTTTRGQDRPYPHLPCTLAQLSATLENAIIVDRHNFIAGDTTSISGMDAKEFRSKFQVRSLPESPYAPEAYDAVWTIALALKNLHELENLNLEDFDYNNTLFAKQFMAQMKQLNFNGISGPISFSGADRVGVTSFMQIHDKKLAQVGLYFPRLSKLSLNCNSCVPIRWHGNQVPIARREFRFKLVEVDWTVYVGVGIVSTGGIAMAISFLIFNLYNRKLKYIKLSSPRLNNVLIIGSIFAYVAVILLGSDVGPEPDGKHFAYVCTIRAYLLSTGFSLAFGAMFAKTYRVHRIFTRSCIGVVKNKLLRDRQLMSLILVLLLIDCLIVTSWATFDPMHRHLQNLTIEIDPMDRSVVYQKQIKVCRSTNGHVWLSIVYGYKSLLLAVGLYMAWETRHVKIQVLNDSKYIGLCVYIVVLTSVLAGALANLLSEKVTLSFLSVTSLILTATTSTLSLLFLPKVYAIVKKNHLKDPVVESSGLKIESNTRRFMVEDTKELLFRAEVQNRVYKRQIEAIDAEMWRLEKKLLGSSKDSVCVHHRSEDEGCQTMSGVDHQDDHDQSSSDSSSEIYTVYLHRPRFIIPISLLHFRNNGTTTTIPDLKSMAAFAASALTGPRSSWPNTSHQASMKKSVTAAHAEPKFRFTSEPKLESPKLVQFESPYSDGGLMGMSLMVTGEKVTTSAESCMSSIGRLDPSLSQIESRKSSAMSAGGGSRTSSFLAALRSPLAYMSGLLLKPPSSEAGANEGSLVLDPESPGEGTWDEQRKLKYSSVPDLWGVRTSPCLDTRRLKNPSTGTVRDSSGSLLPHSTSMEPIPAGLDDPLLRFIPTTNPSPYL